MATKKKRNKLWYSVNVISRCEIECCICGDTEYKHDTTEDDFVKYLHRIGWRYAASDKFCMVGAMCPICFKLPDAQRWGDDDDL